MKSQTEPRGFTIWGAALLTLSIAVSCSSPASHQSQSGMGPVLYVGTAAYEAKVKLLNYDPLMARQLLTDFIRAKPGSPPEPARIATGAHAIIVGDSYHFHNPEKTGGIPLTGYYVDGHSGRVTFRVVEGRVPYATGAKRTIPTGSP